MTGEPRWGVWGEYDTERLAASRLRDLQALAPEVRRHYEFRHEGRRIYARPTAAYRDRSMDQLIVMQAAGHIPPPNTPNTTVGDTHALF